MSADALAVTTRPPFGLRANATRARSISPTSRVSIALNSTADDDAMDWIAANWPIPAASAGSRRTAARVMWGAISLSSSSHFPLMPYSNAVNPVALPPGCARLATNPAPTGSMTFANTIGVLRLACCSAATQRDELATVHVGHGATFPVLGGKELANGPTQLVSRTISLPHRGRLVLGEDLNSESRR